MAKNLQKSADFYRENVGIIDPAKFSQTVKIAYFEPCEQLQPLVAHYFVARNTTDSEFIASTVLSQPVIHLICTAKQAFILGVTTKKRSLTLGPLETYAGVRFRPGGFYPFCKQPVSDFTEKMVPASVVFPQADQAFTKQLLARTDTQIAEQLEALLLQSDAAADPKTRLVATIIATIQERQIFTTKETAQMCNISERALQNLFTTRVGIGLKWILMRARFLEAMERAHAQEKPNWTMVAAEAGYSSQSHFINDFKKVMGVSPRNYVKLLGN